MLFSTYSFPDLTDIINLNFAERMMKHPRQMAKTGIVKSEVIPANSGDSRLHAEAYSDTEYAMRRNEGEQSKSKIVVDGYKKFTKAQDVSISANITENMRRYGKNKEIETQILSLSDIPMNREELDLAHRLTFGFVSSYVNSDGETVDVTVGNGLSLINPLHTLTGSATTFRNQVAGNPTCSTAAIEAAESLFTLMPDNLGNLINMTPEVIITTNDPATVNNVKTFLQSTAAISAPNANVVNVYEGKYRHQMVDRLDTDAKGAKDATKKLYWFLASTDKSSFMQDVYKPLMLTAPTVGDGQEVLTGTWTYNSCMAYGLAILNGQWIVGSKGDGTI